MTQSDFPSIPEGTKRIRVLVWVDRRSVCERMGRKRMQARVHVFADGVEGKVQRIWEGPWHECKDPVLEHELDTAAKFYGLR